MLLKHRNKSSRCTGYEANGNAGGSSLSVRRYRALPGGNFRADAHSNAFPDQGGLISDIVHVSSDSASWLSGRAVEYAGSPLWQTLAGMMIIVLIVSLYMWIRKPKKPTETRAPM